MRQTGRHVSEVKKKPIDLDKSQRDLLYTSVVLFWDRLPQLRNLSFRRFAIIPSWEGGTEFKGEGFPFLGKLDSSSAPKLKWDWQVENGGERRLIG